jgi:hypothetical protein
MKRCINCGAFNNDNDHYCYHCNIKIPHSNVLTCERCGKKVNILVYNNQKKICLNCLSSLHPE